MDEDKQYDDELEDEESLGAHGMRIEGEDEEPEPDDTLEEDGEDEMI